MYFRLVPARILLHRKVTEFLVLTGFYIFFPAPPGEVFVEILAYN